MKNYYSFVYLDNDAIDTLYPQVFGDVIEKSIVCSSEESIDASINAKILSILGSNVSSKENGSLSENIKLVTSTPRKAQLLIKHFQNSRLSIQDIITSNQPFEESLCFVGKGSFFLTDIYDKETGISLFSNTQYINLNNNSIIVLETGNTNFINRYCSSYDDTNRNTDFGVMMHISNLKIKKNIRHLTWIIKRAKHFNFFVFGELIKSSNKFYKISPFAIWQ